MKAIIDIFKKSAYNPGFYASIAEVRWEDAFKTYFKFTFFLSIVFTLVLGILLVPQGVRFARESAPDLVQKYFPSDLEVTIQRGEAGVNLPEPYFIPFDEQDTKVSPEGGVRNVLVIDTTHEYSKELFKEYNAIAWLSKHEIITQSTRGQVTIQTLYGIPAISITQEKLLSWVEMIRSSLVVVVPVGLLITILVTFFGFALYLIPLFLFALIPYFVSWIEKIPLSYAQAYKLSLYAILPGLVIKAVLNATGQVQAPEYISLFVFLIVIAFNLRKAEPKTLFTPEQ